MMNLRWLKIIWLAGEAGGVVPISKISRNLKYAKERLKEVVEKGAVVEVKYNRFQFYKLTSKGLVSFELLKLIDDILESELDDETVKVILELLDEVRNVVQGKELRVKVAPKVISKGEGVVEVVPSFVKDNPWFSVLSKRRRE